MLVLSRKLGESVQIGDGIVVTVVQINARQIRLGFEAPPSVPIRRQELSTTRGGLAQARPALSRPPRRLRRRLRPRLPAATV